MGGQRALAAGAPGQHSPLEELKTSCLAEASSEMGGEVEGN